jgi:nucleoside-diphosphate-sugar epimerase
MSHTILITGGSGYLGGSILAQLNFAKLPQYKKLYALVRNKEQGEAVKQYGAEPLFLNIDNDESIIEGIVEKEITVIYFLIDPRASNYQLPMIKALAENKETDRIGRTFLAYYWR